jgi:hypothetical protein
MIAIKKTQNNTLGEILKILRIVKAKGMNTLY